MKRAAAKKPGRKPGQTSPRIARAARKNGAAGGRPRAELPKAILDKLAPPPMGDPLALARWVTDLSSLVFYASLRGEVSAELEARVRGFKRSVALSMPADISARLEQLLKADASAIAADEAGPTTEKLQADGESGAALRAAPR